MNTKNENEYLVRVYEVLEKLGKKAVDLSKITSFSRPVISRWKHQKTMHDSTIKEIAAATGARYEYIKNGELPMLNQVQFL